MITSNESLPLEHRSVIHICVTLPILGQFFSPFRLVLHMKLRYLSGISKFYLRFYHVLLQHVLLLLPWQQKLYESVVALVGCYGERGIPWRRDGRSVHISALVQQDASHFHVPPRRSLHQRCQPCLRSVLDVRLPVHQQTHDLVATLETRQGQGRVPVGLDLQHKASGSQQTSTQCDYLCIHYSHAEQWLIFYRYVQYTCIYFKRP